MENATKALLIAGAVLIVLALISVGVILLRSTNGSSENAKGVSDSLAVSAFNSQFTQYLGDGDNINKLKSHWIARNISPQNIRMLFVMIEASNAKNEGHQIQLSGKVISVNDVKPDKRYRVMVQFVDKYIHRIAINEEN